MTSCQSLSRRRKYSHTIKGGVRKKINWKVPKIKAQNRILKVKMGKSFMLLRQSCRDLSMAPSLK